MNRKAKGNSKENWLIREFRECAECLYATRASRSLGPWDVCACMIDETWLIQVKSEMSGIRSEDRVSLTRLSSAWAHRMCWIAVINRGVVWQGYVDEESEMGVPVGWYYFPEGPMGKIGTRVKIRKPKCLSSKS